MIKIIEISSKILNNKNYCKKSHLKWISNGSKGKAWMKGILMAVKMNEN